MKGRAEAVCLSPTAGPKVKAMVVGKKKKPSAN